MLVAAVRSRQGASHQLVDRALIQQFTLLLSVPLVLEYEAVLTRPEHLLASGLGIDDIHSLLDALMAVGERVRNDYLWRPLLPDPDDDMVLETAINGRADVLVTFNRRHFLTAAQHFNCSILLPREALSLLRREEGINRI